MNLCRFTNGTSADVRIGLMASTLAVVDLTDEDVLAFLLEEITRLIER